MSEPNLFSSLYNNIRGGYGLSARPLFRRYGDSYTGICFDYLIALSPAIFWGLYAYGASAAIILTVCALAGAMGELACSLVLWRRPMPELILSSAVTGLICGMMMPSSEGIPLCALVSFAAAFVFDGLFRLTRLPAICPQAAAFAVFALIFDSLSKYTEPARFFENVGKAYDPLTFVLNGRMPDTEWYDLLFGRAGGAIGTISAILLIAGGIYLAARKLVDLRISVTFLASVAVMTYLFADVPNPFVAIGSVICSGATVLGAFFLAPLMTCAPKSKGFRYICGAVCGAAYVYVSAKLPTEPMLALSLSVLIGNVASRASDLLAPKTKPFSST